MYLVINELLLGMPKTFFDTIAPLKGVALLFIGAYV